MLINTCVDRRGRRGRMQSRTGDRTPTGTAILPLLTRSVLGGDGVCLDVCFWAVGGVVRIMYNQILFNNLDIYI